MKTSFLQINSFKKMRFVQSYLICVGECALIIFFLFRYGTKTPLYPEMIAAEIASLKILWFFFSLPLAAMFASMWYKQDEIRDLGNPKNMPLVA